jgi:hypothetical protein
MKPTPLAKLSPSILGILLNAWVFLFRSDSSGSDLGLFFWTSVPYLLPILAAFAPFGAWPPLVGGTTCLLVSALNYDAVFIHPQHSTAALGILFIPLWLSVVIGPIAMGIAWLVERFRKARTRKAPEDPLDNT